jgi:uncharacterized repeat protein (TIGR03806 family)
MEYGNSLSRALCRAVAKAFLLSVLSGCGGGSGDQATNTPLTLAVDAGADQTIALPDGLNLDATVTVNGLPPQTLVSYEWSQSAGPGTVTFGSPNAEDTAATVSASGSYVLTLTADNGNETASDSLEVTVNLKAAGGAGLVVRPTNTTECIAPATPPEPSTIRLDSPYPNLPLLSSPVAMVMAPGDSNYWYVVLQAGQVIRFENLPSVNTFTSFVDIRSKVVSGGELGLLGMAFHPDFATNGFVYLYYTNDDAGLVSHVSRFRLNGTGTALDPASEQIILSLPQPFSNHNGGQISFGPDGYLYVGFGDGGSGGDPLGHGQDTSTWLGAMLRIDVDGGTPYAIPADNPFAASSCDQNTRAGQCPEIYAYGLRNPWRWSFDRGSGELWVGDVGQGDFEEIDIITSGGNYGWNIMEGLHCYNATSCDQTGLTLPVAEYDHSLGNAVTGGYVYRGSEIPFLQGHYLYADYSSGRIWGLQQTGPGQYISTELLDSSLNIASFGEDHGGELYVVNLGGSIHKIAGDSGGQSGPVPVQLSAWGCFQAGEPSSVSSSVIPYDINALLWSDHADKERFMAIPDGTTIDVDNQGRLVFPVGSVIGKHFWLNNRLIETRLLLHHQPPHGWRGYSYEWNDAQTDATLLNTALNKDIDGQIWHYPSRAECDMCHTAVAGFTLGPEIGQINRAYVYTATGLRANQLITLESIGALTSPLTDEQKSTAFYSIDDAAYAAERRARSYLHTNCAICHQPGGPGGGNMDLRLATPFAHTGTCNRAPLGNTLGLTTPVIIAPGDPDSSVLVLRMEDLGQYRMPPLASAVVDTQAVSVIREWISNLVRCP